MCEFCTKHGEGRKWYLEMKNYARELLAEELTAEQRGWLTQAATRGEWLALFNEDFVLPAIGKMARPSAGQAAPPPAGRPRRTHRGERKSVAAWQAAHFGQVVPIEDAEQIIDLADSVTRMPCGCRYISTGKTDKRYCFGLGTDPLRILGKYPEARASLEVLEREEAKRILRQLDREGLMHSVWTGVTPYVIGLCNCDADCMAYRGYIIEGGPPGFFRAEYVCQVDPELCTGCKSCISQCQFGALFYSSGLERVYIDPARCFGCGVCRARCQHAAIRATPRGEHPLAAELWLR